MEKVVSIFEQHMDSIKKDRCKHIFVFKSLPVEFPAIRSLVSFLRAGQRSVPSLFQCLTVEIRSMAFIPTKNP